MMLLLTSGDTVTDFLQGFNLILDLSTGSVRWVTQYLLTIYTMYILSTQYLQIIIHVC